MEGSASRCSRVCYLCVAMTRKAHGIIWHNTVVLDESVPEMEGRRVDIEIRESESPEEAALPASELLQAWADWAQSANDGPISDEPERWPSQ